MRVMRLQVHNVMRVKDFDLEMDGHHLVLIGGRNGQGKTSAIKALLMALCGKRGMDFPDVALREGEDHGWVRVDLSGSEELGDLNGFTIEMGFRRRRGGKIEESFRLMDSTGEESPEPRKLLSRLYSLRGFDPLSFEKAKPKEQADMIRQLLGLDFTALDKEYDRAFSERTAVNRQIKELEARRKAIRVPANAPKERLSVSGLVNELQQAKANNTIVESAVARLDVARKQLEKLEAERVELERRITEASKTIDGLQGDVAKATLIDTFPIQQKIENVEELNSAFDQAQKAHELDAELRSVVKQADDLTDKLESIQTKKQDAMTNAKWPVPGMELDEEGVTLGGLPFVQASRAERIRTSVQIAMAMNPHLRLMVSENGSDCDNETLKYLEEVCSEHDYQLIMEFVTRSKEDEELCAVVFEEGSPKEVAS